MSANTNYTIIENDYVRDILDQPRALEATLQNLSVPEGFPRILGRLGNGEIRRIVLTGMGSSFYALHPLHVRLTAAGLSTLMLETSELLYYFPSLLGDGSLIIAVSQSGRSAEIVRLLKQTERHFAIIGVTNTADSPLALQSGSAFLTQAGEEFSVSCKTYVAALMALDHLGSLLTSANIHQTSAELEPAAPAVRHYLASWRDHVIELAQNREDFDVTAIRLDSGDLGALSKAARAKLDAAGLNQVKIFASSGLDKYPIAVLMDDGCPIDAFAVGTKLVVAQDAPALDMAYKLMEYDGAGRTKFSSGKVIYPGRKQVLRRLDHGVFAGDTVGRPDEQLGGEPLLVPVMKNGRRLPQADPGLQASRNRARRQIDRLPPQLRSLEATGWS